MDLGKWAFKNRNLINFFLAVMVVGGILSCYQIGKLEDPVVKVKTAIVVTTYPGASAHQVELEVTDVLEKSIWTMGNVNSIESFSYNDYSLIQVELKSTVKDSEVEQHWDLLRRKVDNATASLPSGATKPVVRDDFGNVFGIFYAVTGDGIPDRELADYAELIKRELINIDGVDRVDIYGKRLECIWINLMQDQMASLGVMPVEVLGTLNGQNQTTYSGYFGSGSKRIRVTVDDKMSTVEDIENLIIQGHQDDQLRIRDIAKVEMGYADPVREQMFYDGERAIGVLVAASEGTDIIKVGKKIEKELQELKETKLPCGIEYHKVFYQPERVSEALGTFIINLIESVLIVIVILMITMGFKSGLIIGIGLVVTVLGSLLFLKYSDGTLQRVSLGAFILAMGMLVDNAIVIIDGILVDLKKGVSRAEAMVGIGKRTAMPLLGATLIAILSFLPIFLSPDTAGVYVRDLFIVLAVSLLLSWVLALVQVPLSADKMLGKDVSNSEEGKDMYSGKVYKWFTSVLLFGLRHRISFVLSMVCLLVLSVIGFKYVKHGFFPDMVYNQLYMEYKLPEGTDHTKVLSDLTQIQEYLKQNKEITHITASVGGTPGRYNLVRSIANPSLSYGELIIDFTSAEELVKNMGAIQEYLSNSYPDAYVKLKRYNLMYKKFPIEAQFSGPDPAVLHSLVKQAREKVEQLDEVTLITTNWDEKVPVITVEYDQTLARNAGIGRKDVSVSLLAVTNGIPISSFYDGIHKDNILVRCLDEQGEPIEDLYNAQIFGMMPSLNGLISKDVLTKLKAGTLSKEEIIERLMETTPLQQVCEEVSINWEDPVVVRFNGQRSQRLQCSPVAGVETQKAWEAVNEKISEIELPVGYTLSWQGEKAASDQSMANLFKMFPLAIMLIVAILIMLFKDYRKPIIIICCIPMVLIGVILAMLLTGKVFDFVAIVGTLGLIGMLVKNAIVLMDEIVEQINSGVEPSEALVNSAKSRLRPVMMASLTTILGMIPLLTDAMFGSLAAAIMGGLLFGTLITLLFLPVLYALFFKVKKTK